LRGNTGQRLVEDISASDAGRKGGPVEDSERTDYLHHHQAALTMSINNIKTVILVMFENRSFDNMLGHLKYEGIMPDADGLEPNLDQDKYQNFFGGDVFYPFLCPQDQELSNDVPHEHDY